MGEVERLKELLARVKPGEWYLMDQECHGDRSVLSYLEVWNEDYDALVATEVRRAHGDGGTDALKLIIETHNALPALLSQLEEMREREKRTNVLLRLLTVGQILRGGDEAILAAGLDPWCVNEGRAEMDDRWTPPWANTALLSQTDEGERMEGDGE